MYCKVKTKIVKDLFSQKRCAEVFSETPERAVAGLNPACGTFNYIALSLLCFEYLPNRFSGNVLHILQV